MTSEEQAFLAAIIAYPKDDVPRLVFADWLEEHDQQERAEFIRVQCEIRSFDEAPFDVQQRLRYLRRELYPNGLQVVGFPEFGDDFSESLHSSHKWSRGFISRVHVSTLDEWLGGECESCRDQYLTESPRRYRETCSYCEGAGHVEGTGPQLCESNPIEWAEAEDRDASRNGAWFNAARYVGTAFTNDANMLPDEVFDLLDGHHYVDRLCKTYPTAEEAAAALSRALILWARIKTRAKRKAEELKDRKPQDATWLADDSWPQDLGPDTARIPREMFDLLAGYEDSYHGEWVRYTTDVEALAALQRAIWQWAKAQLQQTVCVR